LNPAIDDTLYVRYYIKYPTSGQHHHEGIWMGGYNPPLPMAEPAGRGETRRQRSLLAAAEQSHATLRFDHYDYWMNMRAAPDGN